MWNYADSDKDVFARKRALIAELLNAEVSPASPAQQALWIVSRLEPDSSAYNIPIGLRLKGLLRPDVLERSLAAILQRQESLRTTFELRGGLLVQRLSPTVSIRLHVDDLSSCSDTQIESEAYAYAAADAAKTFDLNRGPLLRATLLKLRPHDHILICTMHHIIGDAWSAGVFVRELADNYEAFSGDMDYQPEPLRFQYGDAAVWQLEYTHTSKFQRQLEYWKRRLLDAPPMLELPHDRARPAGRTSSGWSQTICLDPVLAGRLHLIAQTNGSTFFILMLAAFNVLLYRYTGQTDILIGVPVAGRNQVETESLIGLFVNTLALRTDLSGNPRFSTLLAQVRDNMLAALANQDVPFERLVEELQPVRSLAYNPVFQVMFATYKGAVQSGSFGDLEASPYVVNIATSRLDLSVAVIEGRDGHWWIQFEYSTVLFDLDTIARMLGHYEQLLRNIAGIAS
jgi:hypothetical protein